MAMTADDLADLLDQLITGGENEVVEFKEASKQFDVEKTGKYVSALSNEASLRGLTSGWLVFGVSNDRQVTGTSYLDNRERWQGLKQYVHQSIEPRLTIREIHEVVYEGKRVVLLEIPAAPRGIPVSWKGVHYARAGESLVPMSLEKIDEIRRASVDTDWTAVVVKNATLAHLDPAAIARARQGFAERYAARIPESEIMAWDDETFLAKARLTVDGKLTRAALLLLGADTSTHLLSPHPAELTWKLVGEQEAYEHFRLPFLLTASALTDRIRNFQMRLMPPDELIYREISKYDQRSLLEALYNCIAHQDYTRNSRIIITERADRIEFISVGEFFDGSPDEYVLDERTPREYRNTALVEAMTELNLIDHLGYGIRRMIRDQVRRFLPLPDYDLGTEGEVKLTIPGAVIDKAFSQLLMVRTDLPLPDVLALDRVQKNQPISAQATARLRRARLIEGRKPKLHVAAVIADAADTRAEYIRTRGQDDAFYAKQVRDYLEKFGSATRADLDGLLLPQLSEALTGTQKRTKVKNLLAAMRRDGVIVNAGTRQQSRWVLDSGGET